MNHKEAAPTPTSYYENGTIRLERVDIDNSRHYYNEYYKNKNLKSETPYFMNLQCGVKKEYYVCGNLKSETHFFMGKQMGTKKRYFKSGILKRQQLERDSEKKVKTVFVNA